MARKLTPKQKAFVDEYLIDLNATQACIRAGYSKKTADRIGPELLGNPCVSAAIQKAIQERQRRTEVTQDMVIHEIADNAFKPASDLPESDFKHASKAKYLDMLCKHLGAYDKNSRLEEEQMQDDPLTKSLMEEAERINQNGNQ